MENGTKVKLNCRTYQIDKYNPKGIYGIVVGENKNWVRKKTLVEDGEFNPIIVEWENGYRNSYKESQLEIL